MVMFVGFVKVEESRKCVCDVVDEYGVFVVMNVGKCGGSGFVVVFMNELIYVVSDVCNGDVDFVNYE